MDNQRIIYFSDYKITNKKYDKKEILSSFLLKLFNIIFILIGLIFILKGNPSFISFTYYEVPLSLIMGIIYVTSATLDLIRYFTKLDLRNKYLYTAKFILTINEVAFLFIHLAQCLPGLFINDAPTSLIIGEFILAYLVPIISFFDFISYDYNYQTKRSYAYFSLIPFGIYYLILLLISYNTNITWNNYFDLSVTLKMPYPILDYTSNNYIANGTTDFSKGLSGQPIVFSLFIIAVFLICLSILALHLKNKKCIKTYNIPYTGVSVHQDI